VGIEIKKRIGDLSAIAIRTHDLTQFEKIMAQLSVALHEHSNRTRDQREDGRSSGGTETATGSNHF
jgi:hypothetical protein